MTFLLGHEQKLKFLDEKVTYIFWCFGFFFIFYAFPFSPFLIFLLQWFPFYWACFQFKNVWEGTIKTGTFYHGIGTWSRRQFCSEFFTQISDHFRGYFRLHWAVHSDHGIIGKNFSFCRTWVQMMPISINDYDVWRETKALSLSCFLTSCNLRSYPPSLYLDVGKLIKDNFESIIIHIMKWKLRLRVIT